MAYHVVPSYYREAHASRSPARFAEVIFRSFLNRNLSDRDSSRHAPCAVTVGALISIVARQRHTARACYIGGIRLWDARPVAAKLHGWPAKNTIVRIY